MIEERPKNPFALPKWAWFIYGKKKKLSQKNFKFAKLGFFNPLVFSPPPRRHKEDIKFIEWKKKPKINTKKSD